MRIQTAVLATVVSAAVGIFAVTSLRPTPLEDSREGTWSSVQDIPSTADDGAAALTLALDALNRTLDEEIRERRVLEEQIGELRADLQALQRRADDETRRAQIGDSPAPTRAERIERSVDERLAAMGFSAGDVAHIRRVQARAALELVELDDRARREGWVDTPRYRREQRRASTGAHLLRDEIGDDAYDRYLFATRGLNRISVSSVIADSPAAQAGFEAGDLVLRYGGERVFSAAELLELRSSGAQGAPVVVDVLRGGQHLQLTMPRGAMGIALVPARRDPGR